MGRCGSAAIAGCWRRRRGRILEEDLGCEVRFFHPHALPIKGPGLDDHPEVQRLRELSMWSEGQVWSCPEMHGAITGVFKNQIDWIPLAVGAMRPTQGRTLAVMQVCGGSQSFNVVNTLRLLGPLDADVDDPEPVVGGEGV
jgi:arsenic resistance protein ArsH